MVNSFVTAGQSSTLAMKGSTEEAQFTSETHYFDDQVPCLLQGTFDLRARHLQALA